MPVLVNSRYQPSLGGHAPGDVRDAFLEAVDAFLEWDEVGDEPTIDVRGKDLTISAVCGLVWNCSDCLPGGTREALYAFAGNDQRITSYAIGARLLKDVVAKTKNAVAT